MAITGLAMTGFHPNNSVRSYSACGSKESLIQPSKVRFAGAFIGVAGAQGNIPALLAYVCLDMFHYDYSILISS